MMDHFSRMNSKLRKSQKLFVFCGFENTEMKVIYSYIDLGYNYLVDIYQFLRYWSKIRDMHDGPFLTDEF